MPKSLPIVLDTPYSRPGSDLPTVQALSRLWDEIAVKPLWAPPNLWRYAKLRARTRLTLLDPAKVPHTGERSKINDCQGCTDICCVGAKATVLLRLKDIAMLLDIGRSDLITCAKPEFDQATLAARPALRRQVGSVAWQTFPVLRQDSMKACAAINTEGACTLHPYWPLACARFPYAFAQDPPETFYSGRCQSFWIHPAAAPRGAQMAAAAVAAYNERIMDAIMLAYAPVALAKLGLTAFLNVSKPSSVTKNFLPDAAKS